MLLWHVNTPHYVVVSTAGEGEVWCTKERQTPQGVAHGEAWGEKDKRWGCLEGQRLKGKWMRKPENALILGGESSGLENEKKDRKKGEE